MRGIAVGLALVGLVNVCYVDQVGLERGSRLLEVEEKRCIPMRWGR
jgi:hypothetical protein